MQRSSEPPFLGSTTIAQIVADDVLPAPSEQSANLVLWAGDRARKADPFAPQFVSIGALGAITGAASERGISRVLDHLTKQGFLTREDRGPELGIVLTFAGWERYHELQREHSEGPIAFMAMKYGDAVLDRMYVGCFKPAVVQTGFDLRRLDEKPPAGLVDMRMRVEIRKARFLLVDLTHDNSGAYWEAGFAEGLGKPVIYLCEAAKFNERGTHFDTNHQQTVTWSESSPDEAAAQLKDTIRATLPAEARMSDEPSVSTASG